MWKALLWKELRECGLYVGLAFIAQFQTLGSAMDLPLIPFFGGKRDQQIPFLSSYIGTPSNSEFAFATITVIAAIVVGLHQTIWESWRQTNLFLLHRPMPRSQIFLAKLAAGGVMLTAISGLPLLVYCLWAAAPGTHASPFFWGFTDFWWRDVAIGLACYLGAFLTGLRPAWWIGSRTWPLLAAFVIAYCLRFVPGWMVLVYASYAVLAALLVVSILETARLREFP